MAFVSARIFFDSLDGAVQALTMVLMDARETDKDYSFGSLSVKQIMASGLMLTGDAEAILDSLKEIPGTSVHLD